MVWLALAGERQEGHPGTDAGRKRDALCVRLRLRPRLGAQASYTYTRRWLGSDYLPQWAGLKGHARVAAGNTKTLGAVGLTLIAGERDRVLGAPDEGDDLGVDFSERDNAFKSEKGLLKALKNVTLYIQAQTAAVAYNHFITGRTYNDQPQVELKRNVTMMTLGVSLKCSNAWRFEYRIKWRSPEFSAPGPAPDDRIQRYGEIRFVRDLRH